MDFSLKNLQNKAAEQGQRRLTNLLGLDFGASGVKAVRVKKVKGGVQLLAADILPVTDLHHPERPEIPKPLSAYYAALCASIDDSIVRVFNQPLKEDDSIEEIARENLSVPADYRVAFKVLDRQAGRRDSSVLGSAISDETVKHFLEIFAGGAPALHSMEIAGLSAFTAFWMGGSRLPQNETVCLIEAGARYTYIGFFHKNRLLLANRFAVGSETLSQQVQKDLGVDADMARTVLSGGSVDISGPVRTALGPFLKQLSIYREFIERQNKTQLTGIYLSGGLAASPDWRSALADLLDLEPNVWNPFDRVIVPDDLDLARFKGQESRFAAAMGAALAGVEGGS